VILIPTHACSGDDGLVPASEPYGDLDAQNVATCTVRVRWGLHRGQDERLPGCGARIADCYGCGLRTRVTLPGETVPPPCPACGATVRPDVVAAAPVERERLDPTRSIAQHAQAEDHAPLANEKPARRAPARRGKKGAAEPQANGLPLFGK
jgi:hypothetical protein